MSRFVTRSWGLAVALAVLAGCDEPTGVDRGPQVVSQASYWVPGSGSEPLKIHTQNVYLGGDTGPLFTLDLTDIPSVIQATNAFWSDVQQSGIPERVAAIVDDIDELRPHLVGLQEVVGFAVVDLTTGQIVDGADFLTLIEAEVAARDLPYEVVRVQENTSSALPLAVDPSVGQPTRVLAFTDRVVALRRTDVVVSSSAQGTYQARIPLGPVTITRGWIRVSTERDGVPYHFVTTHLETQSAGPVQAGQAAELRGSVLAGLDGITILAGDLNSDAEAAPGDPSWTPTHGDLLEDGFVDAWEASGHGSRSASFTCCQATDLRNGASDLSTRVDFVMVRAAGGEGVSGSMHPELRGEESGDRTANGLWPSDHAGLAVGMRLPRGLYADGPPGR